MTARVITPGIFRSKMPWAEIGHSKTAAGSEDPVSSENDMDGWIIFRRVIRRHPYLWSRLIVIGVFWSTLVEPEDVLSLFFELDYSLYEYDDPIRRPLISIKCLRDMLRNSGKAQNSRRSVDDWRLDDENE